MFQIESNNGLRKSERTKFPIISELRNKVEAQYEELTELLKQDISEIDNVDDLRSFSIALTEKYKLYENACKILKAKYSEKGFTNLSMTVRAKCMETTIAYKDAFQDSKTKFKQFSSGSLTGSEIVRSWLLDPKCSDNGDANLTKGIIASLISI